MRDISFTVRPLSLLNSIPRVASLVAVLTFAGIFTIHAAEEVRRAQAVTPAPVAAPAPKAAPVRPAVAVASTNSPAAPAPGSSTFAAAKPADAKPATAAATATSTNSPTTGTAGKTVDLTPEQKKKIEEYMARAKTSNEELARRRKLLDRNMPNADQVNPTITERTSIPSRF